MFEMFVVRLLQYNGGEWYFIGFAQNTEQLNSNVSFNSVKLMWDIKSPGSNVKTLSDETYKLSLLPKVYNYAAIIIK